MTSEPEPTFAIYLDAIEDAEPGPLRRWLGREAWRRDPVVSLYYDPDGDRIMFRLIDAPSTASGVLETGQPPDPAVGVFLGFDGTSHDPWPTTVALQDFSWHLWEDTGHLRVLREIVGSEALTAADKLRATLDGDRRVRLSPHEAVKLIDRWRDVVIPSPTDEELDAARAAWSAASTQEPTVTRMSAEPVGRPASGSASTAAGAAGPPPTLSARAISGATGDLSPSGTPERRSAEGGRAAEPEGGTPRTTRVGALMARTSPSAAPNTPTGGLPYGLLAKFFDIVSARRDGKAGAPVLPERGRPVDLSDPRFGMTPYLEIRNRQFSERAEREKERALMDLADVYRRRAEIQEEVTDAEERAKELHIHLESMPTAPTEAPRPNALELQLRVSEELVRTRRQREFLAERRRIAKLEDEARKLARELRKEDSSLAEVITTREEVRDARVLQQLQHSLRRCSTYMRHIVHHHPDSGEVIQYLKPRLPTAPDWLKQPAPAAGPQPPGPTIP